MVLAADLHSPSQKVTMYPLIISGLSLVISIAAVIVALVAISRR
jgi:hypothetical protein